MDHSSSSDEPQLASRRRALKASLLLGASATAGLTPSALAKGKVTPAQTEGPFYPDLDNDLTFVASREKRAKGDFIYVHGVVRDTAGKPIAAALVDIWQTDHLGIYDHAGDPNQKKKDKNFQNYGRFVTAEDGRYCFKTIKPRHYGDERFMRTPHIHYKVARRGYDEVTTQLYFSDEKKMNADDTLYNKLSKEDQALCTSDRVPIEKTAPDVQGRMKKAFSEKEWPQDITVCEFDIVMGAV